MFVTGTVGSIPYFCQETTMYFKNGMIFQEDKTLLIFILKNYYTLINISDSKRNWQIFTGDENVAVLRG